jgi:hypothetical protein
MSTPLYSTSNTYNTLDAYNSLMYPASQSTIHPPIPAGTPSMAVQIIPVYGMPGYDALTHNNAVNGTGHFTITSAYPNYGDNCTRFAERTCDGTMPPPPAPKPAPTDRRVMPASGPMPRKPSAKK